MREEQDELEKKIAQALLDIGAVELRPYDPFTWSSGMKAPIYCDNRLTLGYPHIRKQLAQGLQQLIETHFPDVELIAGTSTAGIPHAAWVSDAMDLPMCYVRGSQKSHGKQSQIEGLAQEGLKTVVVEDLISTGGSSLKVVEALQQRGLEVLGVVAIFTYSFKQAEQAFVQASIPVHTLSHYQALLEVARSKNKLSEEQLRELQNWQPSH